MFAYVPIVARVDIFLNWNIISFKVLTSHYLICLFYTFNRTPKIIYNTASNLVMLPLIRFIISCRISRIIAIDLQWVHNFSEIQNAGNKMIFYWTARGQQNTKEKWKPFVWWHAFRSSKRRKLIGLCQERPPIIMLINQCKEPLRFLGF